jgi:hypothetical protein
MTVRVLGKVLLIAALLAWPSVSHAQEAVLTGTVTDSTGGVLPGVTMTAVHEASGNRFIGVTDERGVYRIAARVGAYQLTAELQGFATVARTGVEVLVGQIANINVQMAPSNVQETVTVSAEAPLLDVTTSTLGGNVDPRQVQELPIQGRNWMALAMVAPGSRVSSDTATTPLPDRNGGEQPEYQFAIDGQQVNSEQGYGGQPRYSQDSIAEFQFISNRFDATMGRSTGVQVVAITRSGTNTLAGSVRGNFRDSRFNAKNPVLDRVVPIDNQQVAFTLGGPIMRDKLHFFGHYEYEREPRSSVWNTPYTSFNVELNGKTTVKLGGGRLDYQLSPSTRLMGKASEGRRFEPFTAGNNSHPAATGSTEDQNREYLGQLTQVLSSQALNEIKVGYTKYRFDQKNLTEWSRHWQAFNGVTTGSPRITFTNFTIGGNAFYPRFGAQESLLLRDDFTFSLTAHGRHDMKTGVDYLRVVDSGDNCQSCMGQIDARNGPTPANIEALFPDPFNADTWNLAAISSITRNYRLGVGNFATRDVRPKFSTWLQDDWQIASRLTLNLGIRYDLSVNAQANKYGVEPFIEAGRPNDTNNLQPRIGAAYRFGEQTVVRGGTGLYFAEPLAIDTFWMAQAVRLAVIEVTNDGRPNFAADPFNGQPLPTLEQANQRFCHVRNVPGCLQRAVAELIAPPEFSTDLARTWQSSIGVAHQLSGTMAVEADYIYSKGDHEKDIIDNTNLTFNPATGANYPFSDASRRAYPQYGLISMSIRTGWSSYHALQTSFTKRLSNRWQASATYTLAGLWNAEAPPMTGLQQVPFPTAPDLGGEFTFDPTDQRHRMVFNGIWQVGRGFQVSGLYFLLGGERSATSYGGDLRGFGGTGSARLRPDGTIVPRNAFTQPVRKRFDLRAQQRVRLGGRVAIDGIAEVFNLFNSPNYTINTQENSPQFNRATSGQNRTAQLGFRLTF